MDLKHYQLSYYMIYSTVCKLIAPGNNW